MSFASTSIFYKNELNLYMDPPHFAEHPITDHQFVGSKPDIKEVSNYDDIIQPYFNGLYETGKDIKLQRDNRLPWESDKDGKLYSTPSDIATAKINYLRALLGKNKFVVPLLDLEPTNIKEYDKDKWAKSILNTTSLLQSPDPMYSPAVLQNKLLDLELEYKIIEDENAFRRGLRAWIIGDAPVNEYFPHCFWMKINDKKFSVDERKKLVRAFPKITQGFITDMDIQPTRITAFLKKLAKKAPTNEEEAYLWYKYIVKREPINLNDLAVTSKPPPPTPKPPPPDTDESMSDAPIPAAQPPPSVPPAPPQGAPNAPQIPPAPVIQYRDNPETISRLEQVEQLGTITNKTTPY